MKSHIGARLSIIASVMAMAESPSISIINDDNSGREYNTLLRKKANPTRKRRNKNQKKARRKNR